MISKMSDIRDHGYAWVALAAMFALNVLYASTYSTFGIFMVEFLSHFRSSTTSIAVIGAINMFVGNMAGLVGGPLLKTYGCRPIIIGSSLLVCTSCLLSGWFASLPVLYIFYGVFAGIGYIFFLVGGLVSIQLWFDKRRSLASGIFSTGQSTGVLIWPPIIRWLIDMYSWKGALMILGAINLNGVVFAALLRKPPTVSHMKDESTKDDATTEKEEALSSCKRTCLKFKEFVPFFLFLLGIVFQQMGHTTFFVYTPVRAEELHIHHHKVPFLISVMGILGLFCRPLAGLLGDRPRISRPIMFGLAIVLVGASMMLSTQFKSFELLLITSISFGIFSAGYASTLGAVLVDIAGLSNIEIASGLFVGAQGIGNVLLHPIAGAILDFTGNSNIVFWIFGSLQIFAGGLIMTVPFIKQYCAKSIQTARNEYIIIVDCNVNGSVKESFSQRDF